MENRKKTALVVGGSRGIGRAVVLSLARSGFDIWLTYKGNHDAAKNVKAEVEDLNRTCELFAFNVASFEETEGALREKADTCPPDVVVYNSGIARDNLMVWMTPQEWNDVIAVNLTGFYNVMHVVLFPMIREKRGRVIVISSTSGETGRPGQANYAASKAGLVAAAKSLAYEVGRKNICVNVVSPGVIATEMTEGLPLEKILPRIPLARVGSADEIAAVVNFLSTTKDLYIHGQVIGVNGGLTM